MHLKPVPKFILIAAFVGAIGYSVSTLIDRGYFSSKPSIAASVPPKIELNGSTPEVSAPSAPAVSQVSLKPSSGAYTFKVVTIPWNATIGLHAAVGGVTTQPGSLMAKAGVNVVLERQDDYSQHLAEQVKFAKAVAAGNMKPNEGAAFSIIMGDGYPSYVAGAQEELGKLGQQIEVVGFLGYSRGEDKCMLPPAVKSNPQLARGKTIGAVLRDGDWNICVKWAADNGIPINPDEKTYDADALNFIAVDSFTKADDNYIAGYCEDRPVVSNGKPTGGKRKICQDGTATWTPGDVKVAKLKGGIVPVASTKEYMWQMPAIVIGNKAWMAANRELTQNFLAAAFKGGELVRSDSAMLKLGAKVEAAVYKEESGDYWAKYYIGAVETDKTGNSYLMGGSMAAGVADNARLFGLNGSDNLYSRVYNTYGNITVKYYPDQLKALVPYNEIVNTTYLSAILSGTKALTAAVEPTYNANAATSVVARRSVAIEFETGKATFTPKAAAQLDELLNQVSVSSMNVQLNGHTDSVGNSTSNVVLSKARAEAVKAWLKANAPQSFPDERVKTRGFGDAQPVGDNKTADGRAQNRRVEVVLLVAGQ